jgi:hypothetical protein
VRVGEGIGRKCYTNAFAMLLFAVDGFSDLDLPSGRRRREDVLELK